DPSGYAGGNGFTGGGSGRHGKGSGLGSCASSAWQDGGIGVSCNSCGGALFLGCVDCIGCELFS
ncbi:MAG: hypothetical protein IKZ82_05330, partial [Clostridia bacterium]|nr:hypothetical protein [Clostridia bacterium]